MKRVYIIPTIDVVDIASEGYCENPYTSSDHANNDSDDQLSKRRGSNYKNVDLGWDY